MIYRALVDLEANGDSGVLCSIIASKGSTPRHEGSKMLVYPDGHFIGSVGGGEMEGRVIKEALSALNEGKSRRLQYSMVNPTEGDPGVCGGTVELYLEPILGRPEMIIVGGGHVGKAVAHLAKWLGFRIVITDDRPEFCNLDSNPDADEFIVAPFKDLASVKKISRTTYVVLTTRGSGVDVEGLPGLLASNAAYVGVIGSKRRWLATQKGLIEQGMSVEDLKRIHSPVGLEIHAETPEEIAVSILAEVLLVKNGGSGSAMAI